MPVIELVTRIEAPVERVFDLSLSIDLHRDSTAGTGEEAIAGVTSGLIGMGQEVTWRARHFGVWWQMTVGIVEYQRPRCFVDVMKRGPFREMRHEHRFESLGGATVMRDRFEFRSPWGILGSLADAAFVTRHLKRLLLERNRVIRETAEGEGWKGYLVPESARDGGV